MASVNGGPPASETDLTQMSEALGGLVGSPPPGEFSTPDTVAPSVAFTPISGSGRTPSQSVIVDVVDVPIGEVGGIRRVIIVAIYTDGYTEIVFDGSAFASNFSGSSGVSAITNGLRYTCIRDGDGWLDSFTLFAYAFDTGGNEPASNPSTASYTVTGGVGTTDGSDPVISNITPVTTSSIDPTDTVAFDVTDDRGLARVEILADYTSGLSERVFDGSSFIGAFVSGSSNTPIVGGAHFVIARDGDGWLEDFTLRITAIDTSGNIADAAPTYSVPDGVGISASEAVPPVVTIVSPTPGSNITPDTEFVVEVTDNSGEFTIVILDVTYPDGNSEAIYDGVDFKPFYRRRSSVTPVANGYRFAVRRLGGWPASPTFRVDPRDPSGNTSTP